MSINEILWDSLELGFIWQLREHTNAQGCDFFYTRFSKKICFMML